MAARELWLFNPTSSDVSLSDLGVKVPAGKAVNVYKSNPYLTTSKVKDSVESGAISRRVEAKVLRIVKKKPETVRPKTLDQIKTSDKTVVAKKTKSSVVIDSGLTEEDLGESGEFSFADYGINDIGPVEHVKDNGVVLARPKVDEVAQEEGGEKLEPKTESGVSKQTQIVMDLANKASHPMGKMADVASSADKPFIVSRPPTPDPEPDPVPPTKPPIQKDDAGVIVVKGNVAAERSMKSEAEQADDVIAMETIDVMKVATKTDDGAIVMELKEETAETEDTKKVVKRKRRLKK